LSAAPDVLICERHLWRGKRQQNKDSSAMAALSLLQRHLRRAKPSR
jgi:hypothetical protein